MHINRALLESSDITKHFMTETERKTKRALCQLLIDRGHRKYAERFWKFDFNIVDSKNTQTLQQQFHLMRLQYL